MLFLSNDPYLATLLVEGLLRYWPFANSAKEVMFLNELLEVQHIYKHIYNLNKNNQIHKYIYI